MNFQGPVFIIGGIPRQAGPLVHQEKVKIARDSRPPAMVGSEYGLTVGEVKALRKSHGDTRNAPK